MNDLEELIRKGLSGEHSLVWLLGESRTQWELKLRHSRQQASGNTVVHVQWNLGIKTTYGQGQSGLNSRVVLILGWSYSGLVISVVVIILLILGWS